jgi:hypothetical protein
MGESKMEKTNIEYENRMCKYVFTDDEKRDIAETLAQKTQEQQEVEAEKKSVMSSYKDRLDKIAIDTSLAARMYKDGYEMRNMECRVERNTTTGYVRYVRTDTGEEVLKRKMSMSERQLTLDQFSEKIGKTESDDDVEHEISIRRTSSLMAGEKSAVS